MKRRATLLPLLLAAIAGCRTTPAFVPPAQQRVLSRTVVDYPQGFELRTLVRNLTAPTAIAFDADRNLIVAAGGVGHTDVRLFAYRPDGKRLDIYPPAKRLPLFNSANFDLVGPVGGIVVDGPTLYVSHRDRHDRGVITRFSLADGSHHTVVGNLPAQGEYAVTDLAINPANGRLYFGVGAATNAGVVGTDDWDWVHDHPDFCDQSAVDLKLLGYRFDTRNPFSGIFGSADIAVTAPFHPFAHSKRLRVPRAPHPTAAVYSVHPDGSDLRVESTGIRNPVGLQFNEFGRLFMTNQGMQLRGTRPVANDPDALLWLVPGAWYGWPDFSADLQPVTEHQFQPPESLIVRTGYPELAPLLDHEASGLLRPDRATLLRAAFPSNAGAAKLDFAPDAGPYKPFHGQALVALSGDRAPFANAGANLPAPVGYKVVRVDVETHETWDFIKNVANKPASQLDNAPDALERPTDVKFGPDGSLYIVDLGELNTTHGQPHPQPGTGRILILTPTPPKN